MKLYDYQLEALESTKYNKKGILCLPTGTGKTMIQANILSDDILSHRGTFRMYVVNVPRIILSYQILKEYYNHMASLGIECRYHFVHSGSSIDISELKDIRRQANLDGVKIPFSDIDSSTNIGYLNSIIRNSIKLKTPLILFSTYNSAEKIEQARVKTNTDISIIINDEAHYLVQERFHPILDIIPSNKCYSFTATIRETSSINGRGMNNFNTYGDVIYNLLPRDAINRGKMIRPRIHTIRTEGVRTSEEYDNSFNYIIFNSFKQHKEHLNNEHNDLKPKILVSTRGANDIKNFLLSKQYTELRNIGVNVLAISSNQEVGNFINGKRVKREDFFKYLNIFGKDINKEMIILHYDILTEGIDVPGITTIMPLRELSKGRFIQTYGRCARVDTRDRVRIDSGEISPNDLDSMVKPYAYVILPYLTQTNEDDSDSMKSIIYDLREFGFNPKEDVVGEFCARGISEEEDLDTFNKVDRKHSSTKDIINEVFSCFELKEICSLSNYDYFFHLLNEINN